MKKIFLIDGHALIYKMYYAFMRRPMVNSKGEDTSILFGFTKFLLELSLREAPTHIAVAFDLPTKTFRHEAYPEYKANRSASPELVQSAMEPLKEILKALNIKVLLYPGFEADDVIGSVAKQFGSEETKVYMVTPDKDFGQLIDDNIFQYKPGKSGAEHQVIGVEELCSNYGISRPEQIVDYLTLCGDASDNVPGVRGVGDVGASKLIARFGSVADIYANLDQLSAKQREAFESARSYIDLSRFLVTIKSDIELNLSLEDIENRIAPNSEILALFASHEMNSLVNLLGEGDGHNGVDNEVQEKHTKIEEVESAEIVALAKADNSVGFICEDGKIIFAHGSKYAVLSQSDVVAKQILENENIAKYGYQIKSSIGGLKDAGIAICGALYDIELMHYLLNPERTHRLDILVKGYLNESLDEPLVSQEVVQMDIFSMPAQTEEKSYRRAAKMASAIYRITPLLAKELKDNNLYKLYEEIEMPLICVLADMEYEGVKIDTDHLARFGSTLALQLSQIEQDVRELVDEPALNISSPKQIGVLLYEKLNLNSKVKTNSRNSYPTDEETLQALADKHPVIEKILEYRGVKKLLSTYIEPLPALAHASNGKVHTTYTQSLTATGRLSSIKPNLQNIPVRTEMGREIRKAFVPSYGGYIVAADYSQIELRLMAHLSGDSAMISDFLQGDDIHAATAAKIFDVHVSEVTKEQRRQAKTANFGIIYGISAFGLSQRLGIARAESKALIDEYFRHYPAVKQYISDIAAKAREQGYVETIFGRRRYLPDINSRNVTVRSLAERNAVNAPIQGSAADIIKIAMIRIANRIKNEKLQSRMVMQVHDELIFDVVPQETDYLIGMVKEEMEGVCALSVPLLVDVNKGANWLEAH
ncbi:MAG: DNA polymerase I [Bacteroidales bacterium]|nr:DNA polymerase I [Bacteroidales bacterium]